MYAVHIMPDKPANIVEGTFDNFNKNSVIVLLKVL